MIPAVAPGLTLLRYTGACPLSLSHFPNQVLELFPVTIYNQNLGRIPR